MIPHCRTCVYLETCPIYKVARETQISNIQPEAFGCMWHTTEEEYKAGTPNKPVEEVTV